MNKKNKITFSLVIVFIIYSIGHLNLFLQDQKFFEKEQKEENIEDLFLKQSATNFSWYSSIGSTLHAVEISSDGNYIIASGGSTIFLFNRTSSTPLWNFTSEGSIDSLAISSDGNYIVSGGYDNNIYLFHKSSSTPLWSYPVALNYHSIAISSDGNYIVAGGNNNYAYLFHRSSSTPLWIYSTEWMVGPVAISSTGNYISVIDDYNLKFFHRSSSTPDWTYSAPVGSFYSISMSSDGKYIVAGLVDTPNPAVYLFEMPSNIPLWTASIPGGAEKVVISSDGYYISCASGSYPGTIYFFNRTSSTPLWEYPMDDAIHAIDMSSSGNYILVGSQDLNLYLFYKQSPLPKWNSSIGIYIGSVAISGSGEYFVCGQTNGTVYLFTQDIIPSFFTLYCNKNNPVKDGEFILQWDKSFGAENYSIYTNSEEITEINGELTKIDEGIETLIYPITVLSSGDYYYIVVAHNEAGSVLSNCIYVKVLFPPNLFILSSNAEDPEIDGIFNLIWNTSIWVDNYSVYIHNSYISEINPSITLLDNDVTEGIYPIQGLTNGDYYFIVVAYNMAGNFTSNCLYIRVGKEPSGGNNFFWIFQAALVGIISAIAGICVKIIYSKFKKKKINSIKFTGAENNL